MLEKLKDPHFIVVSELIWMTIFLDAWAIYLVIAKGPLNTEAYGLLMGVLGVWHVAFATAYGFQIGTSAGSKAKDDSIAKLTGATETKDNTIAKLADKVP